MGEVLDRDVLRAQVRRERVGFRIAHGLAIAFPVNLVQINVTRNRPIALRSVGISAWILDTDHAVANAYGALRDQSGHRAVEIVVLVVALYKTLNDGFPVALRHVFRPRRSLWLEVADQADRVRMSAEVNVQPVDRFCLYFFWFGNGSLGES